MKLGAQSIGPKFPEIPLQNRMEQKVSRNLFRKFCFPESPPLGICTAFRPLSLQDLKVGGGRPFHQPYRTVNDVINARASIKVEGDRRAGARENRGREGYGRREEKGREAGFPNWREPGEKEKNFAILRNISQQK